MDKKTIEQIFLLYNLGGVESVEKIEIGFTNAVFSVNDTFILKVCQDASNEGKFEKEVFFYDFFKDAIPVPRIRIYDNTKKIHDRSFMIYPKISGDNLYSKWHLLNNDDRKKIIKQLCGILKIISSAPVNEFTRKFKLNPDIDWKDKIVGQIESSLSTIKTKKILPTRVVEHIEKFVRRRAYALTEQIIALVYWDAHFDNILVNGNEIAGILDFERTELSSIDFTLDIIKRMVDYPKKYMSKEFEKFAKKEDYAQLLDWFREFYPELFDFPDLDKRLDLYAIEHDLDTLIWYPDSKEVKQMICKIVHYSGSL